MEAPTNQAAPALPAAPWRGPFGSLSRQFETRAHSDAVGTGLRTFRALLFVHMFVRVWAWVPDTPIPAISFVFACALTVLCVLAFTRYVRWACVGAAVLMALEQFSAFPGTANHVYLEYFCLVLFAILDPDDAEERETLITALRWTTLVVFFYTGLQKVLLGYYFGGEFLLYAISARDAFAQFFSMLLPEAKVQQLLAEQKLLPGAGPFRTDSILFIAAANAVWIAELVLPVLMLVRRTRRLATLASIALVVSLQLAAREFMFAMLFTQALLLVPAETWNRRVAWLHAVGYAFLFGYVVGIIPERFLFDGGVW